MKICRFRPAFWSLFFITCVVLRPGHVFCHKRAPLQTQLTALQLTLETSWRHSQRIWEGFETLAMTLWIFFKRFNLLHSFFEHGDIQATSPLGSNCWQQLADGTPDVFPESLSFLWSLGGLQTCHLNCEQIFSNIVRVATCVSDLSQICCSDPQPVSKTQQLHFESCTGAFFYRKHVQV